MRLFKYLFKKRLYVRLAKTGSTSLASVIPPGTIELTATLKNKEKYEKYAYDFKFTFIRNPFGRMISSYFMICKSKIGRDFFQVLGKEFHENVSFSEYVEKVSFYREKYYQFDLDKTKNVFTMPWFDMSQDPEENRKSYEAYWVLSHTQGLVEALEFLFPIKEFDLIGRYETLQEDYKKLKKHLKIKKELPHLNSRNHKKRPYQSYYDGATKDLVTAMYKEDLNRFNYSFE